MDDMVYKTLQSRWHELCDQYEAIKAALPPIARWEWASGNRYDLRPHHFKMHPPRGRTLKEEPAELTQDQDLRAYGFDDQNHLVIQRSLLHTDSPLEQFYCYHPDFTEALTYRCIGNQHILGRIQQYHYRSGHMTEWMSMTLADYGLRAPDMPAEAMYNNYCQQRSGIHWEGIEYRYGAGGLLVLLRQMTHQTMTEPLESYYYLDYDGDNRLDGIGWFRDAHYQRPVYARRQPGETMASLTERVKTELLRAIPEMIAEARFTEPLYCLQMQYFRARTGMYFPPMLMVGFENSRQRKLIEIPHQRLLVAVWWSLTEFDASGRDITPHLPIIDGAALAASERLNTEINMRFKGDEAVRILYRLARAFNAMDWSSIAPVTSDFVVYACDQTSSIPTAEMLRRSGATKEQVADWRARGLL